MRAPVFIGDEVTAAGYRLAGLRVLTPDGARAAAEFSSALRDSTLVVITAALARDLPGPLLDEAVRRAEPLVVVVRDAVAGPRPPDAARAAERILGIAQ